MPFRLTSTTVRFLFNFITVLLAFILEPRRLRHHDFQLRPLFLAHGILWRHRRLICGPVLRKMSTGSRFDLVTLRHAIIRMVVLITAGALPLIQLVACISHHRFIHQAQMWHHDLKPLGIKIRTSLNEYIRIEIQVDNRRRNACLPHVRMAAATIAADAIAELGPSSDFRQS